MAPAAQPPNRRRRPPRQEGSVLSPWPPPPLPTGSQHVDCGYGAELPAAPPSQYAASGTELDSSSSRLLNRSSSAVPVTYPQIAERTRVPFLEEQWALTEWTARSRRSRKADSPFAAATALERCVRHYPLLSGGPCGEGSAMTGVSDPSSDLIAVLADETADRFAGRLCAHLLGVTTGETSRPQEIGPPTALQPSTESEQRRLQARRWARLRTPRRRQVRAPAVHPAVVTNDGRKSAP